MISKKMINQLMLGCVFLMPVVGAMGQQAASAAPATNETDNTLRYTLIGVALSLLIVIVILVNSLKAATEIYAEKKNITKNNAALKSTILMMIFTVGFLSSGFAQDAAPAATSVASNGFDTEIYVFISFIFFEFVIILALIQNLLRLLETEKSKAAVASESVATKPEKSFFSTLNETVPIEEEDTLDLQHNYDGIRELDNKVPSWWVAAFYGSILFGFIYMYRMYVSDTLPKQDQELMAENEAAELLKIVYLKNNPVEVDENNVKMLSGADLGEGAALFTANCSACHGDKGQGNSVGPNLTDQYWIHKGGLKNIFYSIKYGWAEKGMKSWKDDFNGLQIAQLASYVHSLQGTNPPAAKEPQGQLYNEAEESAAAPATDSTQMK